MAIDRLNFSLTKRIDDGINNLNVRIDRTNTKITELSNEVKEISKKLNGFDKRIAVNESQIAIMKIKLLGVELPTNNELQAGDEPKQ